jgi:hypothetical protein
LDLTIANIQALNAATLALMNNLQLGAQAASQSQGAIHTGLPLHPGGHGTGRGGTWAGRATRGGGGRAVGGRGTFYDESTAVSSSEGGNTVSSMDVTDAGDHSEI